MTERHLQFGEFRFDTHSGELRGIEGGSEATTTRLPPQPAALLTLLAAQRGGLVTHEEIREALWPATKVDFEAGLHFCIRQIRTALGDSAAEARYIETLPRRGYRLVPEVTPLVPSVPPAEPIEHTKAATWRLRTALVLGAVAAVSAIILTVSADGSAIRIGIMPFQPPSDTQWLGDVSPMAEWILDDLTSRAVPGVGIVGPTTTASFPVSDATMIQTASEYELDYIVNGRFIVDENGATMFAELICVSNGAHVWVKPFDDLNQGRHVGLAISDGVAHKLQRSFSKRSTLQVPDSN